tara:strand:+ start:1079 stop:1180 length:102 start_codon:yes stop_codon:yes gene_type:complete
MEPVADGGGDGHSVFTCCFVDTLRDHRGVMEGT